MAHLPSWGAGYVTDIAYIPGFYHDQAPLHLNTLCLMSGVAPMALRPGFRYCELGCGQGFTANLLAAVYPEGEFHAIDFHPGHIAAAEEMRQAVGLPNITFHEIGFAELAAGSGPELPPFDCVTLHGVYSWIDAPNRAALIEVLRRWVRPGGLVYVSYNALPGWNGALPVQRLLVEVAAQTSGRSDTRLEAALAYAKAAREAGSPLLEHNRFLDEILGQLDKAPGEAAEALRYLVHEYLNDHWRPCYHADVARALAAAKLDYVGPAKVSDCFPSLCYTEEQRALLDSIADPVLRESLADYHRPRLLRRDIYCRGPRRLNEQAQATLLHAQLFASTVLAVEGKLLLPMPVGEVTLEARIYGAIYGALEAGPQSLGQLLALPSVREGGEASAVEVAGMLLATQQVYAAREAFPDSARRFNRVSLAQSASWPLGEPRTLACPGIGSGLAVSGFEAQCLREVIGGVPAEAEPIGAALARHLEAQGEVVLRDDAPILDPHEAHAHLVAQAEDLLAERLRVWRNLGML